MYITVETDVLVIGSEGAGCRAAIAVADAGASTVVVTKGCMGRSGATLMAGADINVDSGNISRLLKLPGADPDDSPKVFVEDILAAGKDINNRPLVEQIVACPAAGERIVGLGYEGPPCDAHARTPLSPRGGNHRS